MFWEYCRTKNRDAKEAQVEENPMEGQRGRQTWTNIQCMYLGPPLRENLSASSVERLHPVSPTPFAMWRTGTSQDIMNTTVTAATRSLTPNQNCQNTVKESVHLPLTLALRTSETQMWSEIFLIICLN